MELLRCCAGWSSAPCHNQQGLRVSRCAACLLAPLPACAHCVGQLDAACGIAQSTKGLLQLTCTRLTPLTCLPACRLSWGHSTNQGRAQVQHRQEAAISAGGSSKLCRSRLEQQWLTASECSTAALVAMCLQHTAPTVQALLPRPLFRQQLCWSCRPAAPQRTRRSSAPSTGSAAAELMLLEAGDRAATLAVHRAGAYLGGQQLCEPLSVR